MCHDRKLEALGGGHRHSRSHRAREAEAWSPRDSGTVAGSPLGDLLVVADHDCPHLAEASEHSLGELSRKARARGRVEHGSEP